MIVSGVTTKTKPMSESGNEENVLVGASWLQTQQRHTVFFLLPDPNNENIKQYFPYSSFSVPIFFCFSYFNVNAVLLHMSLQKWWFSRGAYDS